MKNMIFITMMIFVALGAQGNVTVGVVKTYALGCSPSGISEAIKASTNNALTKAAKICDAELNSFRYPQKLNTLNVNVISLTPVDCMHWNAAFIPQVEVEFECLTETN